MQPLDPLTLPLAGIRLLEASAGTGKTYTLVLLVLRLLLERGLAIDQILVVTFTRAATAELRDRIRQRLRQSLDLLDRRSVDDPTLAALLAAVPPDMARQRLTDALVQLDEAAIHTIHGFCQRILQEHAFESSLPFDTELLDNEAPLRRQVIEDFWRNRFYPASREEAAWAAATWKTPCGLLRVLSSALATTDCDLVPPAAADEVEAWAMQNRELFAEVRQTWPKERDQVRAFLEEDKKCLKRDTATYRLADRVPELLAAMDHLALAAEPPPLLPEGIDKLASSIMAGMLKSACVSPPNHPFFTLFDRFLHCHQHWQRLRTIRVLQEAWHYLRAESVRRKQVQGWLAYDDLLTRLDQALFLPGSGPRLGAHIATRYPAALVDEFQDTDPVQYRIFSTIYRCTGSLFLIGDPKQAIYGFRGADIFTYIRARRAIAADNHATLGVNHRATPAMVRAVNTLFGRRSDAFVFNEDIVFQPVQAAAEERAHPLRRRDAAVPPLIGLLLDSERLGTGKLKTISKERAGDAAVDFCADTIVEMLTESRQGRVTIAGRPLTTGDIAILVRTHREAEAMQLGLRRRGVNSISSSQDSVFASPEAGHLARVLAALAWPDTPSRIRTALATELFGCSGDELYRLTTDEQAWEQRLAFLSRYRAQWQDQGLLPMFQQLLAQEGTSQRLLSREGGERSLTNYLHLAELLQRSPAGQHGMASLLRWFYRQIETPEASEDELIRLENDEHLLRIVTIHKAKGLEFPVVVLPFLWNGRSLDQQQPLPFHDRPSLRRTIDLGSGREDHRLWAEEEFLAEELRLLYVAVTRAKSCCFFCWGRVKGLERTALAHLLHRGSCPADDGALYRELEGLNNEEWLLEPRPYPPTFGSHRLAAETSPSTTRASVFRGTIAPGWSLTSYSRLAAGSDRPADNDEEDEPAAFMPEDFVSVFTFPRGPAAGSCLHDLLQRLDFCRPAADQQPLIVQTLEQAGIDLRWQPATISWLDEILASPLPGARPLRGVSEQDRISELGFHFSLERVDLDRCNAVLASTGHQALHGMFLPSHGLMKGFIDLVFRHQGRYWIADYKSNHLGPSLAHYGPETLAECMAGHQYHLQALIYTLALHRYLGSRISDYRYDTHVGGVFYLFLRAMGPHHPAGTGIHTSRPDGRLIAALDARLRGGTH